MNYFLFTQFEPTDFQNVEFSTVLGQEFKYIIVVGSEKEYVESTGTRHWQPAPDDKILAEQINKKMKEKHVLNLRSKTTKKSLNVQNY